MIEAETRAENIAKFVPLEYRYALDAAIISVKQSPLIICRAPALMPEIWQRFSDTNTASKVSGGLWIEPELTNWSEDLAELTKTLPAGQKLAIVLSRPMARLLPERRNWEGQPLGLEWNGLLKLRLKLIKAGFKLESSFGLHSPIATGLNALSYRLESLQRPALADRLHFAARLRYCTSGPLAVLSTVALIIARKEH